MAKLFAAPAVSSLRVGTFKGIDVSMPDDQIALYRAADALNMIPDATGEVRKRPGIQWDNFFRDSVAGMKVVEMYPGFMLVAKEERNDGYTYSVYFLYGDDYMPFIRLKNKPNVIKMGEKFVFFMIDGKLIVRNESVKDEEGNLETFKAAVGLYEFGEAYLYTDECDKWQFNTVADIIDDIWKKEKWEPDDEYMKTPITIINGDPSGSGTPHQQINLLNPWVTESFCITKEGGNHTFYLNGEADSSKTTGRADGWNAGMMNYFRVRVLAPEEGIETLTDGETFPANKLKWFKRYPDMKNTNDGYNYEFNRLFLYKGGQKADGTFAGNAIIYKDPSGCNIQPTPIEGTDNVEISYRRRNFKEGFVSVCHSMCGGVYGVGGYKDRLFIGGSDLEDGKNIVYYSEMDQPLYIGALNYIHSERGSEILALNGTGGTLAVLTDRGISLVSGQATEGNENSFATDSIYTISTTIPAPKPIGYNNTATFGGEIVYLSEDGVIAIAAKDNYDERYAEHRSAMINRKMLADQPQKILNYGRYLLVFCSDGYCWLLDENQPSSAGDRPYSTHQYEGFRMSGFDCNCAFVEDGILKITKSVDLKSGTDGVYAWSKGDECKHYSDEIIEELVMYGNGAELTSKFVKINAYWETPWIYGSNFYRKKRFSRLALLLGEADLGDYQFKVEGKKNDETEWSTIWDYDGTFCTFNYGRVNYGLFTYRTTHACPDVVRKIKIKKALRFKLRFSNDKINQSFVLREFGLDYVLGG